MSNILTKATVLVLNRNWQAINVRTPQEAFCVMATKLATGLEIAPDEGSLNPVVPRSGGGKDVWENLVWSAKEVNQKKPDRLAHEAGLKLVSVPRAPKELLVSALIRSTSEVEDLKLFLERE